MASKVQLDVLAKQIPRQELVGYVLSVQVPSANEVESRNWQRPLERQLHPSPQQKLISADGWHGISAEIVPLPVKHCFTEDRAKALTGRKYAQRETLMSKQTLLRLQPLLNMLQGL